MRAAEVIVALAGIWVRSNLNRPRLRFRNWIVPAGICGNPPKLLLGAFSNSEVSATAVRVAVSAEASVSERAASTATKRFRWDPRFTRRLATVLPLPEGEYLFRGARTFLSAAACEPQHGVDSPPRWNVSRCCGQDCPRSGINRYESVRITAIFWLRLVNVMQNRKPLLRATSR